MDPETLTSKDLLAVMAQHESSFQRHEAVLSHQEELMTRHSQLLADMMGSIRQLFERLPGASPPSLSPPSGNRPTSVAEPRLQPPRHFAGDPNSCQGFLTQCSLTFELQPSSFATDHSKIAYIITLLSDKALSWASAVWQSQNACCKSYVAFEEEFKQVFDHPVSGREASKCLLTFNQGSWHAADFAIEFRTIAAGSRWNNEALMVCFQGGLSEPLQDELATREPAADLESLIAVAIRLDNRLRERRVAHRKASQSQVPVSRSVSPARIPVSRASPAPEQPPDPPEEMQLGHSRLSPKERERCMRERRCLYCGASGHFRSTCSELSGNGYPHPASRLASSAPLLPRLGRASSLWGRKTGVLGHVSITEASTKLRFGIETPFLSWPLLSSFYKGLPFLLSWIYATLTISCGSDKGTNGRRPSTPPRATMST